MLIRLHSQATTTPKARAAIQASDEPASVLARRFGTTEQTVYKWRHRDSVEDRSHTPQRLQTTLTPAQEAIAVTLRTMLLLALDDLLAVVRELLHPHASRSGLDRCLRRHGVSNLRDLKANTPKPRHKPFKAYEPGYLHIDVKYLPQMADETARRYLFVAIDRATRWVYVHIYAYQSERSSTDFLRRLKKAAPMKIDKLLTDNGSQFTDRFTSKTKQASGQDAFERECVLLNIEHRLIKPRHPQTNGMLERFNGRISDVLASTRFRSREDLQSTIERYVKLYNEHLPQRALKHNTPLQALRAWRKQRPELFVRKLKS